MTNTTQSVPNGRKHFTWGWVVCRMDNVTASQFSFRGLFRLLEENPCEARPEFPNTNQESPLTLMAMEPSKAGCVPTGSLVQWWIAQTQPQAEERVVEVINAAGGYATSPREEVVKEYEDKKTKTFKKKFWTRPIFPSYVFYSGDRDLIYGDAKRRQPIPIIRVFNTTPTEWQEIRMFILAYDAGPIRRANPPELKPGVHVKVISGKFIGVEGWIERFGDTKVLLKVANCGYSELAVDLGSIEPFYGD
jgi:transcription antitermination factor NusG